MHQTGFSITTAAQGSNKITGDRTGLLQLRYLIDTALDTGRASLPDTGGWGFEPLVIELVDVWDPPQG